MQFTTTEIISKMQTETDAVIASPEFDKEQKDVTLQCLEEEKAKPIISNDAYAIGIMLETLTKKINKSKW